MYTRSLNPPARSFFLFGPRGTGKSTWLRKEYSTALWKNLLLDEDYLSLLGDASNFRKEVEALPDNSWVVIDEVQRIPTLLNEVHDLIARFGNRYRFALSGSSARKLKRLDVNLLAGRAIVRHMFPLTSAELGPDYDLESSLALGSLPDVSRDSEYAIDILTAYVGTYLKQEIQQEALVENLGSFNRFLKIAALMNGESINTSGVARDASVARSTVERYFDVLEDTLIGFRLPGWQPKLRARERSSPKFYLFDTGLVRAITERLRDPLSDLEVGKLLETHLLHELRVAISYQNSGGELSYWRSSGGLEIDFIWTRGDAIVAIEVKSSRKWKREYSRALKNLKKLRPTAQCYGIYRGQSVLKDSGVNIVPCSHFLSELHAGNILK